MHQLVPTLFFLLFLDRRFYHTYASMFPPLFLSVLFTTASALSTYAPLPAICPSGSLVRPASGLSNSEEAYRVARKVVADESLKAWLAKTNSGFGTDELPTVRLPPFPDFGGVNDANRLH